MTPDDQLVYWRRRHEADPGSRAFAPLAELCLAQGRIAEALELLVGGVGRHPTYLAAWLILARCHLRTGDLASARRALSEALLLDPDNLVALRLLAEEAADRNDEPEFERLLRRIVRLDPADETTRERLASRRPIAAEAPPPPPAAPAAEPAAAAEPARSAAPAATTAVAPPAESAPEPPSRAPQATATLTLARIYRAQLHHQKALEILRQALSRHPERQEIRAEIAEVEREMAAAAPAGQAPAPRPQDPGSAVPGRQESRPHFEQWLAQLADGTPDRRRQEGSI